MTSPAIFHAKTWLSGKLDRAARMVTLRSEKKRYLKRQAFLRDRAAPACLIETRKLLRPVQAVREESGDSSRPPVNPPPFRAKGNPREGDRAPTTSFGGGRETESMPDAPRRTRMLEALTGSNGRRSIAALHHLHANRSH